MGAEYHGDGYELQWPYELKAIRSFRIERKFNTHARCTFTAVMTEEEAEACLLRSSFEDSLVFRKPAKPRVESWFAGGITNVDIQMEDGISHVQIEALSRSYAMDMEPKNRSYQNKHLTYSEAIAGLAANYPGGDAHNMATGKQDALGTLMVQYGETDWQFMKRLASRVGTVILPDVTLDAPRVYFGVPDLSWGEELKSKHYTVIKDRAAYEELKAHAEGTEADQLHEGDFVRYRVVSGQYCQVGDDVLFKNQMWVVSESVISYESGLLQYEYVLVKRQTLRRKSRRNEAIQGVSLEGRVVKRANNMVKVHLDIDAGHDTQGNWWFPYSGEGNNIFHCLPEEGARIKVYFPSGVEKKAIAINSVRGGSEEMKSRTVFQKPTTKVFEMPGEAKMQLGDDGVLFQKGTVSLHLDGGNITVNASEDLLLVASNRMELGSGDGKSILESIRMRAKQQITLQTNAAHYMVVSEKRVGIHSSKIDFQKVEVDYMELLTDAELKELYIDELAKGEIMMQEIDLSLKLGAATQLTEGQRSDIRSKVAAEASSNPGTQEVARSWMSGKAAEEQQSAYKKRYAQPPASEPEKQGEEEKQAELEKNQQLYEVEDRNRTAVHAWNQSAERIIEQGRKEGKSRDEIEAMIPALPELAASALQQSKQPGVMERLLDATGIRHLVDKMKPVLEPALDDWLLQNVVPQKPDYLSKKMEKTVYLSRYTFQVLILDPQMLVAEFNLLFGVVAIISAIPTAGGSLYLLAAADIAFSVGVIVVNVEKLNDLKNGNAYTNPTFLGMDQSLLDGLGIGIAFVSLASLLKHGLYKTADKIANRKNIAALDDALKVLTNEADTAAKLKTNLPQEMVIKDGGGWVDDLAKSKSLAGADDTRTVGKAKAEGSSRSVEETGKVTKTKNTDPPPYDREKILRNIEESKKAREASNFDKYLQEEKVLLEKLNKGTGELSLNKVKKNTPGIGGELYRRSQELRDLLPEEIRDLGNYGLARVEIPGLKKEFKAHSQIQDADQKWSEGYSPLPPEKIEERIFEPKDVNPWNEVDREGAYSRKWDTEYKILEDVAKQLGGSKGAVNKDVTGKIDFYTDREPCASCTPIIQEFKEMFPNVKLVIYFNRNLKKR
ncbi:deaminase domain-containing protein [Paenibacillus sp. FSL L8-0340]|uniref:deaminase domain-containing protein n=1 Tax=Paenibacillus sp. FSL L8-0340 TaxID=2954685 RepID=UPI0031589DBA